MGGRYFWEDHCFAAGLGWELHIFFRSFVGHLSVVTHPDSDHLSKKSQRYFFQLPGRMRPFSEVFPSPLGLTHRWSARSYSAETRPVEFDDLPKKYGGFSYVKTRGYWFPHLGFFVFYLGSVAWIFFQRIPILGRPSVVMEDPTTF